VTSPFIGPEVDEELRPEARSFNFDLKRCLSSVLALKAMISNDAYTAVGLGTERDGHAVVIGTEGLVLTIGYLVTEAEEVVLTTVDGRSIQGHVLGVDTVTGLGLVHALEPLELPAMPIGDSRRLRPDDPVITAGGGGRAHALAGRLLTRGPFSGYWEYHLNDALFVEPAHPLWSGAALIGPAGELMGIGSLRMERHTSDTDLVPLNMFVPIELLPPILDDLAHGRPAHPPRPWIGVIAQEIESHVVVVNVSPDGPAAKARLRQGDVIRAVAGHRVSDLAGFYARIWALGEPGVVAPLTVVRGGDVLKVDVQSADRTSLLRRRRLN
jgi:S1-C subfamily serine protease